MFSQGQIIFAISFFICFVILMIFSYRKDIKLHKLHYKGSFWILISFLIFIGILFLIKTTLKNQ
ncbi:hypothetical protein B0A78_00270 [Flavobacterium columnare NBRC 100251 = ATCC 23463]|uniref:Uncharacterized protein n=3 Tax=Flavobacterium TaxID=237 RepID=G8X5E5_FLACA|nr:MULTISPECIES: hypothetical protein [Flavobacterium]AEW86177.1 hypothetical protein FCOL_06780 [Flavobacterium columnare ATCC 49512]AMA48627.1 hypothetical protein AWN65_03690 [Flavobacterium covae]AMO19894.1 hypothetical protein UN65_05600 [Flavobacterium columnare]AND65247.1 hypothetical protein AX766_13070 [Flavobacterium covae]ANO48615.1 hypothetical protein Pf1_00367 [Flavobacterium columnare]